ncbi:MAG TPA: ribosome small subunit-dependent GTPase A [Bacteroidales bacterium]|nr:ribosome small subunit-dependent GTPase A [Bacteroidales bacterium]
MNLTNLGFTNEHSEYLNDNNLSEFTIGRVTLEHRERYIVSTGTQEFEAEITGNMRYTASSRVYFPAVGDWVTMVTYDSDQAIIHGILPRKSLLARQAVNKTGEIQIISSNVDVAFIMQSIDNNFNINRLERYLTICYSGGIEPVLVISKIDLATDEETKIAVRDIETREKRIKYILLSNIQHKGLDQIMNFIQKGKTYCVVGSSGVGKSSLINNLLKKEILKTTSISQSTNKGMHATEHRELFILENGGIIIDTPGMRELGITDNSEGIHTTFKDIYKLSLNCKFTDCQHINETGCSVLEALKNGSIDENSLINFRKILREQERFQSSVAEKRLKDKQFGKMTREILKEKKKYKY